jgi:hypothetical protein
MKIKRGRLQQIIREELTRVLGEQTDSDGDGSLDADELRDLANSLEPGPHSVSFVDVEETGEVFALGKRALPAYKDIPASKADEYIRDLNLKVLADDLESGGERVINIGEEDFKRLEKHIDEPIQKRKDAAYRAERERLDIDSLKERLRKWADDAARGWEADHASGNQEYPIDVVAHDLADLAQHDFQADEWDELLWHFDNNEDHLREFIMGSM